MRNVLAGKFYCETAAPAKAAAQAAVVTIRRAGTSAALDVLHKYMTDAQIPVVTSADWNVVSDPVPEPGEQDREGLQTMRNLGQNMAWLLKCIQAGQQSGIEVPIAETANWTNFKRTVK